MALNCLICNRDTGEFGDREAVYLDTSGNYGSRKLDDDDLTIRISICDDCLVAKQDMLKHVVLSCCKECGNFVGGLSIRELPENFF